MDEEKLEEEFLQPMKESVEEKEKAIVSDAQARADDFKDTIEFAKEDISESFDHASNEAAEKHDEILSEIHEAVDDIKKSADEHIEEKIDTLTEKRDDIESDFKEAWDRVKAKTDETESRMQRSAENIESVVEDRAEEIHAEAEALVDDLKEKTENAEAVAKEKVKDVVEEVQGAFEDVNDELETLPVKRREPSIPQYIPKTYVREAPTETEVYETGGSVKDTSYNGYPPIDDDFQPAPKGAVKEESGKSSNTVLWIILAVLVCMLIVGCCLVQGFFGLLNILAH